MTRRWFAAGLAGLAGCAGKARREDLFPERAGEWRRTGVKDLPASAAQPPVEPRTVRRIQAATYEGPGKLEVTVYELASSAAALDAVQRWTPSAEAVAFYKDEYFVVVHYASGDRKALNAFVRDFSRSLAMAK